MVGRHWRVSAFYVFVDKTWLLLAMMRLIRSQFTDWSSSSAWESLALWRYGSFRISRVCIYVNDASSSQRACGKGDEGDNLPRRITNGIWTIVGSQSIPELHDLRQRNYYS